MWTWKLLHRTCLLSGLSRRAYDLDAEAEEVDLADHRELIHAYISRTLDLEASKHLFSRKSIIHLHASSAHPKKLYSFAQK